MDCCVSAMRPCAHPHVLRARFSAVTEAAIAAAMAPERLQPPDRAAARAVDARQELDLKVGAARAVAMPPAPTAAPFRAHRCAFCRCMWNVRHAPAEAVYWPHRLLAFHRGTPPASRFPCTACYVTPVTRLPLCNASWARTSGV